MRKDLGRLAVQCDVSRVASERASGSRAENKTPRDVMSEGAVLLDLSTESCH